jgi:hypothetical protein
MEFTDFELAEVKSIENDGDYLTRLAFIKDENIWIIFFKGHLSTKPFKIELRVDGYTIIDNVNFFKTCQVLSTPKDITPNDDELSTELLSDCL